MPHLGRRLTSAYSRAVVWGRWLILIGWVLAAAAATMYLPNVQSANTGGLGGLVPTNSEAVQTEITSVNEFQFPLLARIAVVQRDPGGLSASAQAETIRQAIAIDAETIKTGIDRGQPAVVGALPITNAFGLFPASREHGTTAITFLFVTPTNLGYAERTALAQDYAKRLNDPDAHVVGVAGTVPGRVQQADLVSSGLPILELATLGLIAVIVGVTFRSLLAPIITLGTAILAFLVTVRVLGAIGELAGLALPKELQPLIIALLLGVITDYSVFFLFGLRRQLAAGAPRREAARHATNRFGPIILVAGLTVTAGCASILSANFQLFRVFGPGLALTVLTALVVAMTLIPALMGILGRVVFWPSHPGRAPGDHDQAEVHEQRHLRDRVVRLIVHRPVALIVAAGSIALLGAATVPLAHLHLDMSIIRSLPAGNPVTVATNAASEGFAPGILSPTVLLVAQPGITHDRAGLARLQQLIAAQPGVAGVVGPREQQLLQPAGIVLANNTSAARYLIIFGEDPLGAVAVSHLRSLEAALPRLTRVAGLSAVHTGFTGDTALASEIATRTKDNLSRIAITAFLVEFVLLAIFLRALLAPIYLMLSSVLVVAAALGLTTFVFQDHLGHSGLTFYEPFVTAVLLIALGSDYNVFGVGRIWEEAADRPLRKAITIAVPRSTRAINTAGITLAGSFALVALIPLGPFRQIAFTMFVGLLLDTSLVRFLLVPSLVSLVGTASGWPGRRLARNQRSADNRTSR